MAQMDVRLIGNLLLLFEAGGKPLETVGQRQELFAAARFEAEPVGDPPERLGDAAEIRDPGSRRGFVHHSTAGCSLPLTPAKPSLSDFSTHAGYAAGPL
jgi:hypothetical protein